MSNTRRLPKPPTEILYARLPADLIEWIRGQADRSGMSMAMAAGAMLAYCRDAGLTLEPQPLLALARAPAPPLARDTSA